jgi:hypothetical protein
MIGDGLVFGYLLMLVMVLSFLSFLILITVGLSSDWRWLSFEYSMMLCDGLDFLFRGGDRSVGPHLSD